VWAMGRRPLPMRSLYYPAFIGLTSLAMLSGAIVIGPLFLLPVIVIGAIAGFVAQPTVYSHWWIVGGMHLPIVAAVILEIAGVLPSTFEFVDGTIVLKTWVLELNPRVSAIMLGATIAVQTLNSTLIAVFQRRAQESAQNQNHAYKWHLERMLPSKLDETGRVPKS
jgi:hypothetical protein